MIAKVWNEYDMAAEWCARRGLEGIEGDRLPVFLSCTCHDLIMNDPDAFADRVRSTAYMLAMEQRRDRP